MPRASPWSPTAIPIPATNPSAEATNPVTNASRTTDVRTWRRLAPIARSSAISRVRWATMIENVLKMMNAPDEQRDEREHQEGGPEETERVLQLLRLLVRHVRGLHGLDAIGQRRLDARLAGPRPRRRRRPRRRSGRRPLPCRAPLGRLGCRRPRASLPPGCRRSPKPAMPEIVNSSGGPSNRIVDRVADRQVVRPPPSRRRWPPPLARTARAPSRNVSGRGGVAPVDPERRAVRRRRSSRRWPGRSSARTRRRSPTAVCDAVDGLRRSSSTLSGTGFRSSPPPPPGPTGLGVNADLRAHDDVAAGRDRRGTGP